MSEIEITRGHGISSRTHHQFHHSLEQACFLAEFYGCGYVVRTSPLLVGTRFEALRSMEALEWQQRGLGPTEGAEILLQVRIKDERFVVKSFSEGVRLVVDHDRRRVDIMIDQRMFGLGVDDGAEHEDMEESDDEDDEVEEDEEDEEDEWENYSNGSDDADDEDSDDVEAEEDAEEEAVIDAVSPSLSLRVGVPDEMLYRRLSSLHDSDMEDEDYSYSTDDSDITDEDGSEDSDEDDYDEAREQVNRENEERWIQWVKERTETEKAEAMLEKFRKSKTDQEYRNYCLTLNDEECRVFQTILDRSHWLREFDAEEAPYAETAARRARWQRAVFADNKCESEGPETTARLQYSSQHLDQFLRQIRTRNGW